MLPELEEAPVTRRPLWRHPASIISAITTVLALAGAGTLLALGVFTPEAHVSGLELEVTDNVVHATWSGPDVPYQVIVTDGPAGENIDVSQSVTGTEIWLPTAAALVGDSSCILVRPVTGNETAPVALDRATLDAQRAQAECVTDATAP